jgi:hypothetical protein
MRQLRSGYRKLLAVAFGLLALACLAGIVGSAHATASASAPAVATSSLIIDHRHTDLADVPLRWIEAARSDLHIAYGHTSHGSQVITGMTGLTTFANAPHGGAAYAWNNGGTGGALDLADRPFSGGGDLGNPNFTAWASATRSYLDDPANADVNVVMWSWCGQVSSASQANITTYLTLMSGLEEDYPDVRFVYMTGHTDGSGLTGNLHVRNQQIRDYCAANDRILYDFEDIESYDPDGAYFGDRDVRDSCAYDGGNWAIEWQDSHTQGVDWYDCESAHSQPLNANLKAYAAWWLWARLAGWDGGSTDTPSPVIVGFSPASARVGSTVTVTGTDLTGATAVKFNGAAASFAVTSETQITATVPAAARSGKIAVTTPGGTAVSASGFKVEPLLSKLSPTAGRRGVIVTITGTGFCASRGTSYVRFGAKKCGAYVSWTSTRIRCRVPAKAGFGRLSVRVTTAGGASNAKTFTVRR